MILLAGKSYQFPTDRQRQIGETEEVIKNGQSRETGKDDKNEAKFRGTIVVNVANVSGLSILDLFGFL
jgi:hypothetical protein